MAPPSSCLSHLLTGAFCSSEVFMGFVKSYIQMFAYSSVTTEDWKSFLFSYFKDQVRGSRGASR